MSWECLASELRLNAKMITFLFSFVRNVVRDDQFQLLDLRHLHFLIRPTLFYNKYNDNDKYTVISFNLEIKLKIKLFFD